jgi:hypothetical protein
MSEGPEVRTDPHASGEAIMQQTGKLVLAIVASIAGIASGLHAAVAQDATPGGYQFFVTPYLWLSSVHSTTKTPLARVPDVNSNVSTIDLLSHLDGVPVMGSVEVRYGPFGFLGDVIHLPVSTDITTHDVLFQGGNAKLRANTGAGVILYRALEDPVQFADVGAGFRAWGFSMALNLNAGLLPATPYRAQVAGPIRCSADAITGSSATALG